MDCFRTIQSGNIDINAKLLTFPPCTLLRGGNVTPARPGLLIRDHTW